MTIQVLLVEDVPQIQAAMAELLASIGDFRLACTVPTEAEAKLWLDEHAGRWQLAVVDLVLDQGSGMSVVAHCARQPARGTVVVYSDYITPGIRQHCLDLGADAVFQKSGDMPAFIEFCTALGAAKKSPQKPI